MKLLYTKFVEISRKIGIKKKQKWNKAKNNLSKTDSIKMVKYAKLINKLDDRIMKIHDKYEVK